MAYTLTIDGFKSTFVPKFEFMDIKIYIYFENYLKQKKHKYICIRQVIFFFIFFLISLYSMINFLNFLWEGDEGHQC